MIGTGLALLAGSALSAGAGIAAGNKAAHAQEDASQSANATQLQMYNQSREDQAPWRQAGSAALTALAGRLGLPGYDSNPAAFDAYKQSSGYDFRMNEGLRGVNANASSRGLLKSGATLKGLERYGQGIASAESGAYDAKLAGIAGVGQTSAAQTGQQGIQTGGIMGQNTQAAGAARASGYANVGNQVGGLAGQAARIYGLQQGGYFNQPSYQTPGISGTVYDPYTYHG